VRKIYLCLPALVLASLMILPAATATVRPTPKDGERSTAAPRRPAKRRGKARTRAVTYTCPMHHDVHLKQPGDCPKCGMELEAEKRGR
jgi:heavy metal-binding protein